MKKLITAVAMFGTCIAPAMALPPKYHGEWCRVPYRDANIASHQHWFMLCSYRPGGLPITLSADKITTGGLVGRAVADFPDYEAGGRQETWVVRYDFGAHGKQTLKFLRSSQPKDGRATLLVTDLNNTDIDRTLREAERRARVYEEPAPSR